MSSEVPTGALVFAGGSGTRMAHHLPKQFIEVDDAPILIHTLRRFQECEQIDLIYVVVPEPWVGHVLDLVARYGVTKVRATVPGGITALDSIFNGLKEIVADQVPADAIVLIHDGVRPVINRDLIVGNVEMARAQGNAITGIPAFETVALKQAGSNKVASVVDRKRAFVLQAPQTFRLGDVFQMNLRAEAEGTMGNFVDQANMQAFYGKTLHLLEGFRGNVKITIPDDVRYFTYLVKTGEYERILAGRSLGVS